MDLPLEDVIDVPYEPIPRSRPPQTPQTPQIPPKTCSVREALEQQNAEDCISWAETNKFKHFLADVRPMEHSNNTATHILKCWKAACASKAKWGHIKLPTLTKEDPITVGELHTYLSEILAAHPDFAEVPVHHEECCGNVETCFVEFLVEDGILVLQ